MMWGGAINLDDLLTMKPGGYFRIVPDGDARTVTINIPGEPEQTVYCTGPGPANQVAKMLTEAGLTGLVEG